MRHRGTLRQAAISILIVCGFTAAAAADTITLSFHGSIDLSTFGGSPSSSYAGSVSWDPATDPSVWFPGVTRYLLDGAPGSVYANLAINGVNYTERIEPFSRFEQTASDLFLELYFEPVVDLDLGSLPDLRRFALEMWTESPPAFLDISHLPQDLSFLADLERRRVHFSSAPPDVVGGGSDDVTVPEPASMTLVAAALLASMLRRRAGENAKSRR